eukprot:scaffold18750_cov191-Amphora_coffeaeformis.AAC.1
MSRLVALLDRARYDWSHRGTLTIESDFVVIGRDRQRSDLIEHDVLCRLEAIVIVDEVLLVLLTTGEEAIDSCLIAFNSSTG